MFLVGFGVGPFKSCLLTDLGGSLLQVVVSHITEINYIQEAILPNDSQWERGHLKYQLDNLQSEVKYSFQYQLLYISHVHTANSSGMTGN
jgi:hypothetical protein